MHDSRATREGKNFYNHVGTPGSLVFDLQVPAAAQTYSMMDYLAAKGFDVFAIDYQNYGLSDRHACGLCVTTDKAALDVDAAVEHIRKLRGVDRVHLVGWSWGANVAALYASRHPDKVGRLVMAMASWTARRPSRSRTCRCSSPRFR